MITKHYKQVKSVLKKAKFLDTYFVTKFAFSPYMACQHGCKYCDGRAERYFVEGDFEKDIVVRENIVEQLDKDLVRLFDLYASLGPDFVLPGSLTLRAGENKRVFFDILKKYYPQHLNQYNKIYKNNFISGAPNWDYSKPFYSKVNLLMKERGLSSVVPSKLYKIVFPYMM